MYTSVINTFIKMILLLGRIRKSAIFLWLQKGQIVKHFIKFHEQLSLFHAKQVFSDLKSVIFSVC